MIYLTILVALGTISEAHTSGTIETEKSMQKLLAHCATHPDATLRNKASSVILKEHSDASYFSESQERSRAGGYFYMGGTNGDISRPNGTIMVILTIMRNVMLSAEESECGALFYNAK